MWMLAALLLLSSSGAAAACPDAAQIASLRALAGADGSDVQAADAAWERLIDGLGQCGDVEDQARALADWSEILRRRGELDRMIAIETRRLALARSQRLASHEAEAGVRLGRIALARGEVGRAEDMYRVSRERFAQGEDLIGQALAESELSRLERRRGDYIAALRHALTSLELRRRVDPPPDLWRAYLSLAVLYEQIELNVEARHYYEAALAEAERAGTSEQIGDALNSYAGFLNDFGAASAQQALPMAQRALQLQRSIGDAPRIASCLLQIGRANFNLQQTEIAQAAYAEAMALAETHGLDSLRAHIEFRWGEMALMQGDAKLALERIERARIEYERQGNRHRLIKVTGVLEQVYTRLGDPLQALAAGREHYRLRNELLGGNAVGKLGALLTNFALAEEQQRNERLRQENALNALRLQSERRFRVAEYLIAAIVVVALVLLGWRHFTVRRLYLLLSDKTRETEIQREALVDANARLTRINRVDSLTGLATRSWGFEQLAALVARAREGEITPALVLLDLDNFKRVNDEHGHPVGDQLLTAVAAVIRANLPDDSFAARVGGEEFIIVLHDDVGRRAEMLVDAIRQQVRSLSLDAGPARISVTLSAGIARLSGDRRQTMRELYAAADGALYAAKHAGRDCVRTHAGPG